MYFKLKEEELLKKEHIIVSSVFGILNDNDFIKTLEWVSKGYGFSYDYVGCTFPDDQDEYDIFTYGKLEGVEFWTHGGEEIVIDYNAFYYYLKKSCDWYVSIYPNDTETVNNLLANFRELFDIPNEG